MGWWPLESPGSPLCVSIEDVLDDVFEDDCSSEQWVEMQLVKMIANVTGTSASDTCNIEFVQFLCTGERMVTLT